MKIIQLKSFLVILVCLSFVQVAVAQLRLPSFFSDNMVLQRETDANIWGWAHAGSQIKILGSWSKDTITTNADGNGRWKATIKTSEAGGPYQLTVIAEKTISFSNVLLGDLYLCSGQSNMEWGGNQNLKEIIDELPQANNPNIRLLQVSRTGAFSPQEQLSNSWQTLNASSLKPFSAIGYFIAKELNEKENIPIGVINASWGGTPAEVWTAADIIAQDEELLRNAKVQGENAWRPHEPGVLWNGMLAPLVGYNIKGFFWYQGESNVGTWSGYDKLMKEMIKSWRKAWKQELPFYFVQIAPYAYNNQVQLASLLREQQSKTAVDLPKTGMAVITDLVDNIKDIHPTLKKDVAHRLTALALAEIYNKTATDYKSPIYKSHEIKGNKMEISFHYLTGNLQAKGKEITELYICGPDKVFHKASAEIKKDKLVVYHKEIKQPLAVRFGFSETAMPNLFNSNGLPVSPFRTDDWAL